MTRAESGCCPWQPLCSQATCRSGAETHRRSQAGAGAVLDGFAFVWKPCTVLAAAWACFSCFSFIHQALVEGIPCARCYSRHQIDGSKAETVPALRERPCKRKEAEANGRSSDTPLVVGGEEAIKQGVRAGRGATLDMGSCAPTVKRLRGDGNGFGGQGAVCGEEARGLERCGEGQVIAGAGVGGWGRIPRTRTVAFALRV